MQSGHKLEIQMDIFTHVTNVSRERPLNNVHCQVEQIHAVTAAPYLISDYLKRPMKIAAFSMNKNSVANVIVNVTSVWIQLTFSMQPVLSVDIPYESLLSACTFFRAKFASILCR